jgi:hypothetical protein
VTPPLVTDDFATNRGRPYPRGIRLAIVEAETVTELLQLVGIRVRRRLLTAPDGLRLPPVLLSLETLA